MARGQWGKSDGGTERLERLVSACGERRFNYSAITNATGAARPLLAPASLAAFQASRSLLYRPIGLSGTLSSIGPAGRRAGGPGNAARFVRICALLRFMPVLADRRGGFV